MVIKLHKPRKRFPGRAARMETLGANVSKLAKRVYGRRGLADGAIAREWATIVGDLIAKHSQPDRVTYANRERSEGLLHLRVDHSAMATELQHLERQLLERINGYFGYKAVARLRFIHGPLADRQAGLSEAPKRAPEPPPNARVHREVEAVDDPELKAALERLGDAVAFKPGEKPAKS